MRNAVLMVPTSSELSRGGNFSARSLTDFVVLVIAASLSSDAAAFEGSATPSRIEAALLSSGAASSDGSVTPSWTNLSRDGDLRVFFSWLCRKNRVIGCYRIRTSAPLLLL